ncbi:hypothetical protein V8D89_004738 [Ganoderma adspersum]
MRQKIDAALFRKKDAQDDGHPHWPDQIIPVEFKSRKKGNIKDPFEDLKGNGENEGGEEEDEEDQAQDQAQEDEPPELEETVDDDEDENEDDDDPRAPDAEQFKATSYTRKAVRGQLTSYVDLLFSVQQQVSIFMLFIIRRRFRILRWDRAGVIVTPSIDYVDNWKPLCEFLRRVSSLPDEKVGFDPTTTRLSSADAEWSEMDDLAVALDSDVDSTPRVLKAGELEPEGEDSEEVEVVFDYQRKLFAKSIADSRWPRYKLRVHDGPASHSFVVGKPVFCAHGAIGCGTCGYIAVDCATQCFVWLKDAWRASYNLIEQEGLILERINAAPGIPGVPTVVCHGDVGKQRTATASWWEHKNPLTRLGAKRKLENERTGTPDPEADSDPDFRPDCLIRRHKHYRLVVREVCMSLKNFKHGKQLVQIMSDCLTTHCLVATDDGLKILHRDVTDDNIVIFPKIETKDGVRKLVWKGILTDWEISKPITVDGSSKARQPERTGNWQFMSVNLLNAPGPVNILDDLESLLFILIYYAIRYVQSSIAYNSDVATFLDECFNCYTINEGLVLCGERKSWIISLHAFSRSLCTTFPHMAHSTTQLDTERFLSEFLPYSNDVPTPTNSTHNPFYALKNANKMSDNDVSKHLIAAVNKHNLSPRLRLSQYNTVSSLCEDQKPSTTSAAIFRPRDVPEGALPLDVDQIASFEFRSHRRSIDPFDNLVHGAPEKARKRLFDGISSISELVFAAQQRVFFFMLLFIGRSFRLLRWDRAGVVTTPSIDYFKHPGILCDILWRIPHLDDNALGFDPSATRLRPTDVDFLRMDIVSLPDATDILPGVDTPREYLVGRPVFRASDMVGRGTRGYVALNCKTGRFVWLKDAWRAAYAITETEGDVLRKLNEASVENVPTLRQHPLPLPSPSRHPPSHSSSKAPSPPPASPGSNKRKRGEGAPDSDSLPCPNATAKSDCPLRQHKHYRIVVEEVCMPLRDFQYGRQLLLVVLDCLQAHHQAATKPDTPLLHRDISGGNIFIYPRVRRNKNGKNPQMIWSGILSDWELAKPINTVEAASKATQEERMGTYQYMSVNLLNHITKPVAIPDELESFFHVLIYYSIRYLRSNCTCIQSWIDNYFYKYLGPGRTGACGQKSYTIEATGELRVLMCGDPLTFRSPMDAVLASILKSLKARYHAMYHDAAQAAAPPPVPDPEASSSPSAREPPTAAPSEPPNPAFAGIDPAVLAQWEADWEAEMLTIPGPTEEERKLAARLDDHGFMLALLARQVGNPYWSSDDRVPTAKSEIAAPECKAKDAEEEDALGPPSSKRRRTAERNASLPARLHASARHPRPRPQTHPVRVRR